MGSICFHIAAPSGRIGWSHERQSDGHKRETYYGDREKQENKDIRQTTVTLTAGQPDPCLPASAGCYRYAGWYGFQQVNRYPKRCHDS